MTGENYLKAAYSYLYIRDFARAAEAFRKAIESNPDNPTYYFHASLTALRNECHDLAKEWAEEAVRLDPTNPLYLEHRFVVESSVLTREGHEALLEGDHDKAIAHFRAAVERDPLNDEAHLCLKRLNALDGQPSPTPRPDRPEEAV